MYKIDSLKKSYNLYNYLIAFSLIARNNYKTSYKLNEIKDFFAIKETEELIDFKAVNSANIIIKILEKLSPESFNSLEFTNKYSVLSIKDPKGENVFRISINSKIETTELKKFEEFYNSLNNYLYLFFYQKDQKQFSLSEDNTSLIQKIIISLDIWHGNITFENKLQKSILIEDASNDSQREYFKTVINSITIAVRISALAPEQTTALSLHMQQEAFIIINRITDLKSDGNFRIYYSVEIKTQRPDDQINQSTIFSTKVFPDSQVYPDVELLYNSLKNS